MFSAKHALSLGILLSLPLGLGGCSGEEDGTGGVAGTGGSAGTGGTVGPVEATIKGLCERLDECRQLVGVGVSECVQATRVCVDDTFALPSEEKDWAVIADKCLEFSGCQVFAQCYGDDNFVCSIYGGGSGGTGGASGGGGDGGSGGAGGMCGDNVAEPPETCDGTDLAGADCVFFGFTGGTLACSASCDDFDFTGCTGGPMGWTCPVDFHGTADGCDCGCGVIDPDCANGTVASCEFCDVPGSCNPVGSDCPGDINPTQNWLCDGGGGAGGSGGGGGDGGANGGGGDGGCGVETLCFPDGDSDGSRSNAGGQFFCETCPSGFLPMEAAVDCDDGNSDVYPGNEQFYYDCRPCGMSCCAGQDAFDYNCDGVSELQYPNPTGCLDGCTGSGFLGEIPSCGVFGDFHMCRLLGMGICEYSNSWSRQPCR